MNIRNQLNWLESRLQTLIEGGAARLFPATVAGQDLAPSLVEAMRGDLRTGQDGEPLAPNLFIILAHPSQSGELDKDPAATAEFTRYLGEAAREAGLSFSSPPAVRFQAEPAISPGKMRVLALHSQDNLAQTDGMETLPDEGFESPQIDAFLIVNGVRMYPLTQSVVNIGRRPDNHLVIDDRRVSRTHAQLRLIDGRYVIFDLDSSGGTLVNGGRIRQRALAPGDVISLAGVPLIYGIESSELGETRELGTAPDTKDVE